MSDTTTAPDATPALPPVPNYAVRKEMRSYQNGEAAEVMIVAYGEPARSLTVKALDLGDQWDLAEMTGDAKAGEAWTNMAQIALSVRNIDGVPVQSPRFTRDGIRHVLNKLGLDGLRAASMALGGVTDQAAPKPPADQPSLLAAAGN